MRRSATARKIDVSTERRELAAELEAARQQSDRLFAIIRPEHIYDRPIDARHRVIFYIGHLDGFDSIQICREGLGVRSPNPEFDSLFQAGIDPDSSHLPTDQPSDWPSLATVRQYCRASCENVDRWLTEAPLDTAYMALEHRLMHLETLAYMFHNFPYDAKFGPHCGQSSWPSSAVENSWCEIPAGDATLGKPPDDEFGWDNEFDQHTVHVPAFRVQKYPITNGEYLQFVKEGAPLPNFWREHNGRLVVRGMFSEFPLPLDWPAWVSLNEAQAYANCCGFRLMSEPEFHRASFGIHPNHSGNFDFRHWDPVPVTATPSGDSAFGAAQLIGNGWEWTATQFAPFPGFQPRSSYPGYSANFFDGDHFVMKGASPRTGKRLLRPSFRNWFRKDYPYMYAKFRCVTN